MQLRHCVKQMRHHPRALPHGTRSRISTSDTMSNRNVNTALRQLRNHTCTAPATLFAGEHTRELGCDGDHADADAACVLAMYHESRPRTRTPARLLARSLAVHTTSFLVLFDFLSRSLGIRTYVYVHSSVPILSVAWRCNRRWQLRLPSFLTPFLPFPIFSRRVVVARIGVCLVHARSLARFWTLVWQWCIAYGTRRRGGFEGRRQREKEGKERKESS